MNIIDVSEKEYTQFVQNPFSKFDTANFVTLNKSKVDEIKFFIFENNKKRFGLAAGIKNGILKCPFSATFGIFSEIAHNNKIKHYHDAISSLKNWAKESGIQKIIICTPPLFYNEPHITKFQNALLCNGFKLLDYDVNFQFDIKNRLSYDSILNTDARRNLKIAIKNNLQFEITENLTAVYKIIKQNREEKGFPLWMTESNIIDTSKIIQSDYFLVSIDEEYIASAYVQHITKQLVNIVYWGNIQKYDKLYPMNYLAKNIYEYYCKQKDIQYISIGTSTLDGIPNFGLCDFKESIGCKCSPKLNFELDIFQ